MKNKHNHPIFALWCHPRSMSTAVERVMRERGDMTCFHEPLIYYYYVHLGHKALPHFDIESGAPTSLTDIFDLLIKQSQNGPVFFKDMSYYIIPEVFEYAEIMSEITHVFLIRDPRKSILSYFKLDPNFELDEVGYEAQWIQYEWLSTLSGVNPVVIQAEKIQSDPDKTMRKLWEEINLEYRKEAFSWNESSLPKDWQQVAGWHQSVSSSQGIRSSEQSDAEIQNQFDEMAEQYPKLQQYWNHHDPFYRRLKNVALSVD